MEALNYYTNEMITIPLDPAKTPLKMPSAILQNIINRKGPLKHCLNYAKKQRMTSLIWESIQTSLDIALTEDDLAGIKEELAESGYIKRKTVRKKVKVKNTPLHYISSDGYHIYVGKNNLQNDELTFNFASGNDWWFHAKAGSRLHVIVKTNGEELPDPHFRGSRAPGGILFQHERQ